MTRHEYGMGVFDQHAELLRASAISPEVARQRNYQSVDAKTRLASVDIPKAHRNLPGLLIPAYGPESVDGEAATWQYRPDHPNVDGKGKPRKYVTAMRGMVVDVPPAVRAALGDPARPLWITEGSRKADSAVSHGIDCLSLLGVWNWRGSNAAGGRAALASWEYIAVNGRDVFVCFDSDVMVKDSVRAALLRITGLLEHRKATVHLVILPDVGDGKTGLDDFLAAGGSVDDLDDDGHIITPDELKTFTRGQTTASAPKLPPAEPHTLGDVEHAFTRWLHDDDPVATRAVLACYAANHALDGDPVWLMLVGGSGIGKTERLTPVAAMPGAVMVSSISGEAALLSATPDKDRRKDATGGLLARIPERGGMLILKDFTSILSMHRDKRNELLGALREIYDGRWDREVGTDGGRFLTWVGRVGLLAGCTTAIDTAHAVVANMGTRYVQLRLTGEAEQRWELAASALDHAGGETAMRTELRDAVRGLLEHLPGTAHPLDTDVRGRLIALAELASLARSPVERDRDHAGEISLVLDPEAPTRIVKMLAQLWRACGLLGLDTIDAWRVVARIGMDSIPKLRRAVIACLAATGVPTATTAVAQAVDHPSRTVRRALEDLTAHGVTVRHAGGEGKADLWELSGAAAEWLAAVTQTVPTMSGTHSGTDAETVKQVSEEGSVSASIEGLGIDDDIVGKVGSASTAAEWDWS